MRKAVYPGSFDPVTFGHLDIIERSARMSDHLIIGVLNNNSKTPLFSVEERVNMLKSLTKHLPNVEVESFGGLLVDFVRAKQADAVIRGLRAVTDFEYELQIAQTNRVMAPEIDTVFLTTNLKYSYLSSSIVKEIAAYGGEINTFVPACVAERVMKKMEDRMK
ncbi:MULTISPECIES: pantetheine-phosphate adenylyltransferase [Lacrimispora]|jgi:pantetheine-phosphate adenylyltransferase|uniref:Phosphopantetheine adenylyltransferase n=1 Tax=Lacrimispora sphenoides JCM 1415 TaxID=1297793 RepID=A0ABY1C645_9FIRM|nr:MULTISPECIES: pantetheine-phosphate adenylyltransferase [Lacrimispora]EXG86679.1 Phosphopantetheine adenylyltransferase [Clostridium sp. ASBs410]MDR7814022.1 pantetheine-phosphate adenylyltransferase [Lacrimispora sp.]SET72986.1 Phosphopantetheine adenylyltransferase [[Clostridium] sphenoides JCM 1415]SEU29635.1 Phosphopantetheine adenylyltransferase [Lacrimispora sphenoides]SUY50815.1 pantetheine-phosphate adenylyltransferase [Lacrimispora sphenoides]